MEPGMRTYREIGRLCVAWSYLEGRTENILWGVLDLNNTTGPLISWNKDIRKRWETIIEYAFKKHNEGEIMLLKKMNKDLKVVARDRNIIVHGLVHAKIYASDRDPEMHFDTLRRPFDSSLPCWTIFQGEGKGKNFPISAEAVTLVRENIINIAKRVEDFCKQHKYFEATKLDSESVEIYWPKPLE